MGTATVLIHPESSVTGKNLVEAGLREKYGELVLGIRRRGEPLMEFLDQPGADRRYAANC